MSDQDLYRKHNLALNLWIKVEDDAAVRHYRQVAHKYYGLINQTIARMRHDQAAAKLGR